MDRLLVVSALAEEQATLRRRLKRGPRPEIFLAVTGDGRTRAEQGLARHLDAVRPSHLLAIGLGGGLSPGLDPGEILMGRKVVAGNEVFTLEPWGAGPAATFVTAPGLVDTQAKKRALWLAAGSPPVAACDLESASYGRVARRAGVPLSIVRIVSDGSAEDLPAPIVLSTNAEGSVRTWEVALRALFQPASWRPLGRFAKRLNDASHKLAEVVLSGMDGARESGWPAGD